MASGWCGTVEDRHGSWYVLCLWGWPSGYSGRLGGNLIRWKIICPEISDTGRKRTHEFRLFMFSRDMSHQPAEPLWIGVLSMVNQYKTGECVYWTLYARVRVFVLEVRVFTYTNWRYTPTATERVWAVKPVGWCGRRRQHLRVGGRWLAVALVGVCLNSTHQNTKTTSENFPESVFCGEPPPGQTGVFGAQLIRPVEIRNEFSVLFYSGCFWH